MSIKESEDLVALVKASAAAIKSAKADGQINWRDAGEFIKLLPKLRDALNGANKVVDEIKTAPNEELQVLLTDSLQAMTALVEAVLEV